MGVGKGLSRNLFPDDALSKDELLTLAIRDFRILFNSPLFGIMRKSKAILLSKSGSKVAEPAQTRMIVLNSLARKIVEKTVFHYVRDDIWQVFGQYQQGGRPSESTLSNITWVLNYLIIAKRGRKRKRFLLFVDFQKAFDSVDRSVLTSILHEVLADKLKLLQVLRLLAPQKITLEDSDHSFWQEKGVP